MGYIGIGIANKDSENLQYREQAKKNALNGDSLCATFDPKRVLNEQHI